MAVHYPQPPTAQYQILDDALIYTQVRYKIIFDTVYCTEFKELMQIHFSAKIITLALPVTKQQYNF